MVGWLKEVAPSDALRSWFGHDTAKWEEFCSRYHVELEANYETWRPYPEFGCGLCVTNVPQVFRLADHDKAEVYDPGGETEDTIQQEAIDICPVSCIYWQE